MYQPEKKKGPALLVMVAIIAVLGGCTRSAVPPASTPKKYSQEKVQAADHWRSIAIEVADKVREAIVLRDDLAVRPVFVALPDSRTFALTYHQLLKTELVSRGIQVSEAREPDSMVLDYDVLTVHHDPCRSDSVPDTEIVVNTRLAYNNRYVIHVSSIRYINDRETLMYLSPGSSTPRAGGTRMVRAVNR